MDQREDEGVEFAKRAEGNCGRVPLATRFRTVVGGRLRTSRRVEPDEQVEGTRVMPRPTLVSEPGCGLESSARICGGQILDATPADLLTVKRHTTAGRVHHRCVLYPSRCTELWGGGPDRTAMAQAVIQRAACWMSRREEEAEEPNVEFVCPLWADESLGR
ncbi:hypothetical protein S40288_10570 [Stachybotrys chartarum IBT 40288]|nr:hypothetical protein S40288_10570 [Stachybotrys chartarum IBT 40288]